MFLGIYRGLRLGATARSLLAGVSHQEVLPGVSLKGVKLLELMMLVTLTSFLSLKVTKGYLEERRAVGCFWVSLYSERLKLRAVWCLALGALKWAMDFKEKETFPSFLSCLISLTPP